MPANIKIRSASVEDLGNIVKQMIDGVLGDNDQVAKLRQAVFEEYYSKKLEQLKRVKAEISADQQLDKETENYSLKDTKSAISEETCADSRIQEENAPSGVPVDDQLDPPVVRHVIRRQKYIKVPIPETPNSNYSNIALALSNKNTTLDLTQTNNASAIPLIESCGEIKAKKERTASSLEIKEWRSSLNQKGEKEANGELQKTKEIPFNYKSRGEIAFENWKTEKNNTYRRKFIEDEQRKRLEKASRAREMEKKEAANAAYLYWRRQQEARRKMSNKRKRILAEMEAQKFQTHERRSANSQAFRAWKRQKDIKLRERRLFMTAYNQQNNPPEKPKLEKHKPRANVTFNVWLDQLDSVLHEKYLRERRYLVRSFYCQPAYFGSAAICRT